VALAGQRSGGHCLKSWIQRDDLPDALWRGRVDNRRVVLMPDDVGERAQTQLITSAIRGAVPNSVLAVPISRKPTAR
jgi:hypothetical protein